MGDAGGCIEFVSAMNALFSTALILNDGHEIYAVLEAGGDPLEEAGKKFPENEQLRAFLEVKRGWPAHHMEAILRDAEVGAKQARYRRADNRPLEG